MTMLASLGKSKRRLMSGAPPKLPQRKQSQDHDAVIATNPCDLESSVSSHGGPERPPVRRGIDATAPAPPRGRGVGLVKRLSSRLFARGRVGDGDDSNSESDDDSDDEEEEETAPKARPTLVQRASSRLLSTNKKKKAPSKRRIVARSDYGQSGMLQLMAGSKRTLRVQEQETGSVTEATSISGSPGSPGSPVTRRRTGRDQRKSKLADMDVPEVQDKRKHYDRLSSRPARSRQQVQPKENCDDRPMQPQIEHRQQRPGFVKAVSRRMKLSSRKLQV